MRLPQEIRPIDVVPGCVHRLRSVHDKRVPAPVSATKLTPSIHLIQFEFRAPDRHFEKATSEFTLVSWTNSHIALQENLALCSAVCKNLTFVVWDPPPFLYGQISSILLLWREILSAASRPRFFWPRPLGIATLFLTLGLTGIPAMYYHGRLCENRFRTAFPHENLLCQAG
jgi:hypothetical protein